MLNTGDSGTQTHCDRAHAIRRADKELRGIFTCGGYVFTIEDCAVASRICVVLLRRARIQRSSPILVVTVRGARLSAGAQSKSWTPPVVTDKELLLPPISAL